MKSACGVSAFAECIRNIVLEAVSESTEVKFVEVEFRPHIAKPSSGRALLQDEESGVELTNFAIEGRRTIPPSEMKPKSRLSKIEEGLERLIAAREFV
jgi:hypothetical protein